MYLDFSQVCSLFPKGEEPTIKIGNGVYKTENGEKICFAHSREYDRYWYWYGVYIYNLQDNGISKVSFTISNKGILVLPIEILLQYAKYADYKEYSKGNRYYIRIKEKNNKLYLHHSSQDDIDINKYFKPYKFDEADDSYKDLLKHQDIKKILKDAKKFVDFEEQYKYKTKDVKFRNESRIQKERIAILENHTCQICGFSQHYINPNGQKRWIIEVDHIIEKSKGGGENIDNLLVLCPNCHAKKTFGVITIDESMNVYENGKKIDITNNHIRIDK